MSKTNVESGCTRCVYDRQLHSSTAGTGYDAVEVVCEVRAESLQDNHVSGEVRVNFFRVTKIEKQ